MLFVTSAGAEPPALAGCLHDGWIRREDEMVGFAKLRGATQAEGWTDGVICRWLAHALDRAPEGRDERLAAQRSRKRAHADEMEFGHLCTIAVQEGIDRRGIKHLIECVQAPSFFCRWREAVVKFR